MMYKILLLFIILFGLSSLNAQDKNIFNKNWCEKYYNIPEYIQEKHLNDESVDIQIYFDENKIVNKILPTIFGSNTTFRNGSDQLQRLNLYKNKIKVFRYPAGSGSNLFFFDGIVPEQVSRCYDKKGNELSFKGINGANKRVMNPHVFVDFKKSTDSEAIVVVNYFYARYGITEDGKRESRVKQAAEYAASFVRKMNIELGADIKYWEVGNECYGAWEHGFNVEGLGPLTGKEYGEDFIVFVEEMKAIDPSIKVGAVLTKDKEEVGGIETNARVWNKEVVQITKDYADFFILHEYFTTTKEAILENLQANIGAIEQGVEQARVIIKEYGNHDVDYPIVMTEFNSRGAYNCSFYNAQFISQVMCEQIKSGVSLAASWASEWKWDDVAKESKSLFALNDPEQANYTPRPTYLPYYFFEKCMGDLLIEAHSNDNDLKVYASTFTSGDVGLLIINLGQQNKSFNINTGKASYKCDWYHCYAPTIDVLQSGYKKFFINEQTSDTSGGGPVFEDVSPYNSIINNSTKFEINANGLIYLVLRNNDITSIPELNRNEHIIYIDGNYLYLKDEIANLYITDLSGKIIITQPKALYGGDFIDLSELNRCLYLVNYTYKGRSNTFKITLN